MNKVVVTLNIFIFLLLAEFLLARDVSFTVRKRGTKEVLEGVNICWQLVGNEKTKGFGISNRKGTANLTMPIGEKTVVVASCIGYKTLVDTIFVGKTNDLNLQEDVFNLNQVVVLGHSKPTPIDSSLYTVRVIDKKKIISSGATNLGDLFLTEPNIEISSDLVLGTRIEMLGLAGSNVKVMVDGVPIIGRLNGQLDLSQISMENVDHIEVIEGPMSVVYGNNALAGTINIITHKNKYFDTEVNVNAGYEDVKKFDAGANVSHKVGRNTFIVSGNYSDFYGVDFEKATRSMDWKPHRQYTASAGYLLNLKNWNIDAKASYYNSKLTMKGDVPNYIAYDSYFFTDRYTVSANLTGKWNENNHLNVLVSQSYYNRSSQTETKDLSILKTLSKGDKKSSQKEQNNLLRAVWHHKFQTALPLSLESGIDFDLSSMKGRRIRERTQTLGDYAVFANLRYSPWKNVEVQPGIRCAYNTDYDAPVVYSLNAKWNIVENLSWRVSVAKGFRAPTVKELYFRFNEGNHSKIYGNEDLKAEESDNYSTSLDYNLTFGDHHLKTNLQFYYNDIDNLINLIARHDGAYQYNNIEKYKTRGGSLGLTYFYKNWLRLNASSIFTGRYNRYSGISDSPKFNVGMDWIAGLQVKEPNTKITFNTNLKLYGKQEYFYYNKNNKIEKGNYQAYEMLNVSISRSFWKNRLQFTVGAKNLTDITNVALSGGGGGHSSGNKVAISYGRAYFVKANFKINEY